LILLRGVEQRIEAEATTGSDAIAVRLRRESVTGADLPESVLQQVVRTGERVLLDDASALNPFSADDYIRRHRVRSVLCLPLTKQAKLIGVLYLENNLTTRVFTPTRNAVLKLLASQAALSLENTRLFSDLQERETRIRRFVDSKIIGIVIAEPEGGLLDANDAFLEMVGYDRDDLIAGRVRWREMTPPEWLGASQRAMAQIKATGSCEPYEKEYVRKDGHRVPVLVGAAALEGSQDVCVAFVLDLTERKRAEQAVEDLAGRLIHAQEEERSRIGRELHDHISQMLSLLTIKIDQLRATSAIAPGIGKALDELRRNTSDITDDVHRLSHRLHSSTLDYLGLVPALQKLTVEFSDRHGIPIAFTHAPLPARLPSEAALCLFRVAEESLTNVAKHSKARSARVHIAGASDGIRLTVEDSGEGFDVRSSASEAGLGFVSMRERLRILHGTIHVDSAPARGTRIDAWIPPVGAASA
jgi:PAS domain S-box-containing protein